MMAIPIMVMEDKIFCSIRAPQVSKKPKPQRISVFSRLVRDILFLKEEEG